jgi:hypothetical protein
MRASSGVALAPLLLCAACNQILGIEDPPEDGVPAITGQYVVGADFRTNTTLNTVVMFQATVSYDRSKHIATMAMQPLSATTHGAVGSPSSLKATVIAGQNVTFSVDSLAVDVVAAANASGDEFAFSGTVAGVIKDEMSFCGVVTGTYTTLSTATPTPLPSITIGALKNADPSSPVPVNCNGDTYTP